MSTPIRKALWRWKLDCLEEFKEKARHSIVLDVDKVGPENVNCDPADHPPCIAFWEDGAVWVQYPLDVYPAIWPRRTVTPWSESRHFIH